MSHAPSDALERRRRRVWAAAAESIDALIVTSLPNITYLTNFTGSAAIVVLTGGRLHFLTDSRYQTAVASTRGTPFECPDQHVIIVEGSYDAAVAALLRQEGFPRIGFEGTHLTVSRLRGLEALRGGATPALIPIDGLIESCRVVKDQYEIGVLREAGARLSEVAVQVLQTVRGGQSERELAFAIDGLIRNGGFERTAFETIVASGPQSALPHARPSKRILGEGDLVVLDFGGVYDSYCVDLTRTVSVGQADSRAREVFRAVRDAHDCAVDAVAPGQSRFAIDAAARESLTAVGMGQAFGHGTGHGLGLEIHEDPRIVRRRPDVDARSESVAPGMVFTIEPGAYFPAWGGVRIEDDVLVTETGGELLTQVTLELLEVQASHT